jgi:hypothetical protein
MADSNNRCQAGCQLSTLKQLSVDTRDFITNPIDVLKAPVDPCTFLRQYVATNTPVLIEGATHHWPATELWDKQYLDSKAGSTEISVELTPNGYGDAVTAYETESDEAGQCFCMPHSSRMQFQDFTDLFFQSKQQQGQSSMASSPVIPYLSVSVHGPLLNETITAMHLRPAEQLHECMSAAQSLSPTAQLSHSVRTAIVQMCMHACASCRRLL